jgi:aspartate/methionine/tyrosine aminotransferase
MPISIADLGASVIKTEYAVRGKIVARANELERQGRSIIYCNIGNPQALEQKPLTYLRQVLSLASWPELLDKPDPRFPADAVAAARAFIAGSKHGIGAYSDSKGVRFVRDAVADFIKARDSIAADPEAIYLTDGASKGVQTALRILIADPEDGIMVPIPQYPLYSATITLYGGRMVGYYLDESSGWKLSRQKLEEAFEKAGAQGTRIKAICVINPGNPTGSILDRDNIAMILAFAREKGISVLADEVYQENVYREGDRFVSFARVLEEEKMADVSLFSFHSCSKGFLGECGLRGGYMEIRNIPAEVVAQITKLQSVSLCANLPGQVATYVLVRPPRPGDPSYALYVKERDGILSEMRARARLLAEGLNAIPGISCAPITGAMYAFPTVKLPAGRTDEEWSMALLEATGICVVPGTGFGQVPGTGHFRTTILPPTEKMKEVVSLIAKFQAEYR